MARQMVGRDPVVGRRVGTGKGDLPLGKIPRAALDDARRPLLRGNVFLPVLPVSDPSLPHEDHVACGDLHAGDLGSPLHLLLSDAEVDGQHLDPD